jgi:hypothetical protein
MAAEVVKIETAVETAVGCPYGVQGEQAIQADEYFLTYKPVGGFSDEDEELAFLKCAAEADNNASNVASAILACETCDGSPRTVDLRNKVCAFALDASLGNLGLPRDIREMLEARDDFGT